MTEEGASGPRGGAHTHIYFDYYRLNRVRDLPQAPHCSFKDAASVSPAP